MLFLLVTSVLALAFESRIGKAQGTVTINADGSITPSTAPISTLDNVTYALTGNISESVVVDRGNIVVDGAGHTIQGAGSGTGFYAESVNNVTIVNVTVADFSVGIWANTSSDDILSGNSVTGNGEAGVYVETSSGDTLTANSVIGNYEGIVLDSSSNNTVQANDVEENPLVGIFLYYSANNTLSANDVTYSNALGGAGIDLESSPYNTFYGNNVTASYDGADLTSSGGCVFSQNVINNSVDSNFRVDGSTPTDFINWVDASNLIDGKPIYYLVNQNGVLFDGSTHPSIGYLAIVNCTDITAENLTLANTNWEELQLAYSTNCTITQNNIINNHNGIHLYSSINNTVSDNNVTATNQYTEDNIILDSSYNNTVSGNNVTRKNGANGIFIDSSSDNTVSGNIVTESDIALDGGSNNTVTSNLVSGCTYEGLGVGFGSYNTLSGNTVTQNGWGIGLGPSFEDTVSGNNVTGNGHDGISLVYECSNDTVLDNVVSGNPGDGIDGDGCSNATVSCNDVAGNGGGGIAFYSNSGTSSCNTVFGNSVVGNRYGILLNNSGNNTVYHNSFINNTQQAVISGSEPNTWDEGYPSGGNYWSDYNGTDVYSGPYQNVTGSDGIGDTPYVIDANNTDHYPLVVHDLAIADVVLSKTIVGQGYSVSIYVTAADQGNVPETFNAAVYANLTFIEADRFTLPGGNSAHIAFTWDTSGFAYGNYTISAYVWPVQNETNMGNNNMTGGKVCVSIPGDINGDGTVDIFDAIILGDAFNSTPSMKNWNANADINGDGIVDIYDAIILAGHLS